MGRGERRGESYFKNEISYSSFHFTVCFRTVSVRNRGKRDLGTWGEGGGGQGHDDDDDDDDDGDDDNEEEEKDGDDESVNMSR